MLLLLRHCFVCACVWTLVNCIFALLSSMPTGCCNPWGQILVLTLSLYDANVTLNSTFNYLFFSLTLQKRFTVQQVIHCSEGLDVIFMQWNWLFGHNVHAHEFSDHTLMMVDWSLTVTAEIALMCTCKALLAVTCMNRTLFQNMF